MPILRGGLAFESVDLGWFHAARAGDDRYSTRLDANSTLCFLMVVRLNIISTVFRHYFDTPSATFSFL